MGKNTSSKEFPTPVESRDRKDKKVNEKKQTKKKDRIKNIESRGKGCLLCRLIRRMRSDDTMVLRCLKFGKIKLCC